MLCWTRLGKINFVKLPGHGQFLLVPKCQNIFTEIKHNFKPKHPVSVRFFWFQSQEHLLKISCLIGQSALNVLLALTKRLAWEIGQSFFFEPLKRNFSTEHSSYLDFWCLFTHLNQKMAFDTILLTSDIDFRSH